MGSASQIGQLAAAVQEAHAAYLDRVAHPGMRPWWTAVIITSSSEVQARLYGEEIQRRQSQGALPRDARFLVLPDPAGQRIGSGTATLLAARRVLEEFGVREPAEEWWRANRALLIHSGGDSRRLPAYSLAGKLFSALPVRTAWGEVSTVFDETLALSTPWAERMPGGLLAASGDVLLTFDANEVRWDAAGCTGVAMRQPAEVGTAHGVYVIGSGGRVYGFLQKPSIAKMREAGALTTDDSAAVDTGLLRFDPSLSAGLCRAGERCRAAARLPVLDLYQDITFVLAGQSAPPPVLAGVLDGAAFHASLVSGEFTHVGTTAHFRRLMTEPEEFQRLYEAHLRLARVPALGVTGPGVEVGCVFRRGARLEAGALAVECWLEDRFRAGRGSIAHGLHSLHGPIELPPETVVHQTAVRLSGGESAWVIRAYGVDDDPKSPLDEGATWFGRPMLALLKALGIDAAEVWPGIREGERSLWNARLYPAGDPDFAWSMAAWMMGLSAIDQGAAWRGAERLALADFAGAADLNRMAEVRSARAGASWQMAARALCEQGADIRPMLVHAPSLSALAEAAEDLAHAAEALPSDAHTTAAARHYQAHRFYAQAGRAAEAERERQRAFESVRKAAELGVDRAAALRLDAWRREQVQVELAARVDFGGGWSDTPPFCFDWGGTVLNAAVTLDAQRPVRCTVRRLNEFAIRLLAGGREEIVETSGQASAAAVPGDRFAIPRCALRLCGITAEGVDLRERLRSLGGGIEIETQVQAPMGSGLGSSSILAAAVLRALAELAGQSPGVSQLSDLVLRLEQMMGTGGGWQDQAGGALPGVKLLHSGPGLRQQIRVEPVRWDEEKRREFHERFVVYDTGIQRIAVNLLAQVVGSYLARETHTVEVLHSIKTLAHEMRYAMEDGDWGYLGELLSRHWALNIKLDPNTTNAPIGALLEEIGPFLAGAKLAGAGGGGFLLMIARSAGAARELKAKLRALAGSGSLVEAAICDDPLRVTVREATGS